MLYALLKPVVKAALRLYFGRIVCNGLERIDEGGPMILLANHTASFMDAILVATFVKRRIHFFARGDVFGKRWADRILRSLGMMPVYRLSEGRDKLHLNDTSNDEALQILSQGGAVLIFCEGVSDIAKVLKPLKKGPFRLAATAADTLEQAPLLVPLGINYSTPTHPFGAAFINASEPLRSDELLRAAGGQVSRAATEAMRATAAALEPLVWHVERIEDRPFAEDMLGMLQEVAPRYSFAQSQQLLRVINSEGEPVFREEWEEYRRWQLGYPVKAGIDAVPPTMIQWFLILVMLPVAIAGFGWNLIPVALARDLANRKVKAPDFWAPVFVALAIVFTVLYWLIVLVLGLRAGHMLHSVVLLTIGGACGVFFLKVYRPLAIRAIAPLRRVTYRRINGSYETMTRYRKSLLTKISKIVSL